MVMQVAVAVSGRGSNLAALLDALDHPDAPARVVLVLSNSSKAGALAVARQYGIATHVFEDPADANQWRAALARAEVSLIVLAGYLKLVPASIVQAWKGRIINIHPALLPRYGGPGMYGRRVHEAVLAAGDAWSGATVHLVTEQYDQGDILAQARVPVRGGDTPETLAARVLEAEHRLLPAGVLAAARAGGPTPYLIDEASATRAGS